MGLNTHARTQYVHNCSINSSFHQFGTTKAVFSKAIDASIILTLFWIQPKELLIRVVNVVVSSFAIFTSKRITATYCNQ